MAATLAGKQVRALDQTGLAQKGVVVFVDLIGAVILPHHNAVAAVGNNLLAVVIDHGPDHAPHGFQPDDPMIEVRELLEDAMQDRSDQGNVQQFLQVEEAGLNPIVHVMIVVGDVIRQGRALGLGRSPGIEAQIVLSIEF